MKVDKKIIAASIVSGLLNMGASHAMEAPIDRNKVAQISEKLSEMGLTELDNEFRESFKHKFKANDAELNSALETVKRVEKISEKLSEMGLTELNDDLKEELKAAFNASDADLNAALKKAEQKIKEVPISSISENNPFVVLGIDNQELIQRYEQYIKKHEDYEYNFSMDSNFIPHDIFVLSDDEVAQIKKEYKKQSMKYHPDRNTTPEAEEMFKKTSDAYKKLKSFAQFT